MGIGDLAPQIATLLGVTPETLILLIIIVGTVSNLGAKLIPQSATGWLGAVRKVCAVLGAYVPSRIAPGVTVHDVAKAALETPPIPQQVAADKAADDEPSRS